MVKKAKASKLFHWLHRVPRPVLLSLFIVSLIVSTLALRHNNEHMIGLRQQLYTADKNNGDVDAALNSLRSYIYRHMNTNLSSGNNAIKPPIQLKYTYQRLEAAAASKVNAANTQLYTDAENYCQVTVPNGFYGAYRIPCVQDYLSKHSLQAQPQPIPAGLYEFDFVSPSWSPDFAGWSLVVSALLLVAYLISLFYEHIYHGRGATKK